MRLMLVFFLQHLFNPCLICSMYKTSSPIMTLSGIIVAINAVFFRQCSTRVLSGPLAFCYLCIQAIHDCWGSVPHAHCYADDKQIYLSFKPNSSTSQKDAVRSMEGCIEKIRRWLIQEDSLLMIIRRSL